MRVLFFLVILTVIACDNSPMPDPNDKKWDLPPNTALTISFKDSGKLLDRIPERFHSHVTGDYIQSMVYYLDINNDKVFDTYTIVNRMNGEYPFFKVNLGGTERRFAELSIGGRTWYIDWPNGQTDTLYANYRSDFKGPNDCNCSEPLVELTLNGKPFKEKTDFSKNGVYIFE